MNRSDALTTIKAGLAQVPTSEWNVRVALCLAVQTIEKEFASSDASIQLLQEKIKKLEESKGQTVSAPQ